MLEPLINFLDRSPTPYHAAEQIETLLAEGDFTPLKEGEKWELEAGKGYFVTREGALVCAFRLPKNDPSHAVLLASHIDSPALKIKPQPEMESLGVGRLGTESYGAPLLYSWLDRDLAIAGRIFVLNQRGELEAKTVFLDDYPVIIPSVAIHLNREVNDKGLILQKEEHLRAITSIHSQKNHLEAWLKKHHPFQKVLSSDLFLVPLEKGAFVGFENELIASYRLDNLTSAYAALVALLQSKGVKDRIQMSIFWDHEEIGSKTHKGADSVFVSEILERICQNYQMDKEDFYRMKSRSLCLSCDVTHGYHPNYPEKYDVQNAAILGKGPAIKFSARYATTGATAAPIIHLAEKKKIPIQTFTSRADLPSGGTVGAMMGASSGIATLDLGIACWSMHSIRETIAAKDELLLVELLTAALNEPILRELE